MKRVNAPFFPPTEVAEAVPFQSCGKTTLIQLTKSNEGDFEAEVVGSVESVSDYLATICILVQRDSRGPGIKGIITIDTLELSIVDPSASRK